MNEEKLQDYFKNERYVLLISIIICLIYTLPFAINGNFNMDDYSRSVLGYTGWETNSRPFSAIIMSLLSSNPFSIKLWGDNSILDFFPVTLMASTACMILSSLILIKNIKIESNIVKVSLIVAPVISPFWIGNITFRFDSLCMSISVLLSVISAKYVFCKNTKKNIISAFLLFISLGTYQSSFNAFIISVFFIWTANSLNLKETAESRKTILKTVIISLTALIAYKLTIVPMFKQSDYTEHMSQMLNPSWDSALILLKNIAHYIYTVIINLSSLSGITLLIIVSYMVQSSIKTSKSTLIKLLLIFFACFGILCILKHPSFNSRAYVGFGFIMMFIFLTSYKHCKSLKKLEILISIFILTSLINVAIVANLQNDIQRSDRFYAERIANKLIDMGYHQGDLLIVDGIPKKTFSVERVMKKLPLTKEYTYSAFSHTRFKYALIAQYINSQPDFPGKEVTERSTEMCHESNSKFNDSLMYGCKIDEKYIIIIK